ncbi:MAG TPA: 2-amino-4-hydroxy-6-hydroxymethyldihydropteridine diphosphokinase [Flavobacterium sp.]
MNKQHLVILSLGSNLGDRLDNLNKGIDHIHRSVGTVINVSKVYESPAWGFEGEPFYNCAISIHTLKSAEEVLKQVKRIEDATGRPPKKVGEYESRIIDIDVIAFNEEIIKFDHLQIPHPLMQERLFVLLPMRDLNLDWRHPIFQQYLPELLEVSQDQDQCKVVHELKSPIRDIRPDQCNYIAIEGNIGAGKTTLANRLAEDLNAKTVLERFADNPFLPKFYDDQTRYAFPLEMSFLADRYQQISDDLAQFDLFREFIIADYHIFKSLIFAKVTLSADEYRLYRKLFDIIYREIPKPDLYIYLYQNSDKLLDNIKRRGRSYEQDITPEYLEKINQGYLDFVKSQSNLNVLIIDVSERDFVENQEDYVFILDQVEQKLRSGVM